MRKYEYTCTGASQEALVVKNPPPMQRRRFDTWVGESPLEESIATHSSILAWRIPCTEEPGGLLSMGSQRVEHD